MAPMDRHFAFRQRRDPECCVDRSGHRLRCGSVPDGTVSEPLSPGLAMQGWRPALESG